MIIDAKTKILFKPVSKDYLEATGHHVAIYDMVVGGEPLGMQEIVVSKGKDTNTIIETSDGAQFDKEQLAEALIHAGHKVE